MKTISLETSKRLNDLGIEIEFMTNYYKTVYNANEKMTIAILEFIKSKGYNTLKEVYNNGYKISWKSEIKKTKNGIMVTMIPYLEEMITFGED